MHQTAIGLESIKGINWENKKILDIGCGNGSLTLKVLKRTNAEKIIGIDIDKEEIRKAKKINNPKLQFFVGNASELEFEDKTFDAVFCNIAFQQFKDKEKSIQEISRVLKQDGEAIINYIEEISDVLKETIDILNASFERKIAPKRIKISKKDFNKISKAAGFNVISYSKKDTYYFKDLKILFRGYKDTIKLKIKSLKSDEKKDFMKRIEEKFLNKKTENGFPDEWKVVNAKLKK